MDGMELAGLQRDGHLYKVSKREGSELFVSLLSSD